MSIDAGAFVATLAGPGRDVEASVDGLLELWPPAPDRLGRAVLAAGGPPLAFVPELDVVVVLGEYLADVVAYRETLGSSVLKDEVFVALLGPDAGTESLVIEPALADRLPAALVALAGDIGRRSLSGCMRVAEAAPGGLPGLGGMFSRATPAEVILLDGSLDDRVLAETFGHELTHALDPHMAEVDHRGAEAFAEALTPLLLEHLPESVEAAGFLVASVLEEVPRRHVPRPTDLAAVLVWALAEVGAGIELEILAAHPAPGPGVNAPTAVVLPPSHVAGEGRPKGGSFRPLAVPAPGPGVIRDASSPGAH